MRQCTPPRQAARSQWRYLETRRGVAALAVLVIDVFSVIERSKNHTGFTVSVVHFRFFREQYGNISFMGSNVFIIYKCAHKYS